MKEQSPESSPTRPSAASERQEEQAPQAGPPVRPLAQRRDMRRAPDLQALQRTVGNRAVGRLLGQQPCRTPPPVSPSAPQPQVIARKLWAEGQLKLYNLPSFQIDDATGEGKLAMAPSGADTKFNTSVTWGAETNQTGFRGGEGSKMTARYLGPDHPVGTTPGKTLEHITNPFSSTTGVKYVAAHLLSEELGGPGTEKRNLDAVPTGANTPLMAGYEDEIKWLVNEKHKWLTYTVEVAHSPITDKKYLKDYPNGAQNYASKLTLEWAPLDITGTAIADKANKIEITVDPPKEKVDTPYSKAEPKRTEKALVAAAAEGEQIDASKSVVVGKYDKTRNLLNARELLLPIINEVSSAAQKNEDEAKKLKEVVKAMNSEEIDITAAMKTIYSALTGVIGETYDVDKRYEVLEKATGSLITNLENTSKTWKETREVRGVEDSQIKELDTSVELIRTCITKLKEQEVKVISEVQQETLDFSKKIFTMDSFTTQNLQLKLAEDIPALQNKDLGEQGVKEQIISHVRMQSPPRAKRRMQELEKVVDETTSNEDNKVRRLTIEAIVERLRKLAEGNVDELIQKLLKSHKDVKYGLVTALSMFKSGSSVSTVLAVLGNDPLASHLKDAQELLDNL